MLDCIDACPCRGQCPAGCDKCQNPICYFTYVLAKCLSNIWSYSSVLILSTYKAASVPVLTNAAGRDDKDFNFEIDEEAEVDRSCSLTWQNELYVFGGSSDKTQISKVTSCRLEPIGQLESELNFGDCVNFANDKVILCFSSIASLAQKTCRMASSPTGKFSKMSESQHKHRLTRIATDNGEFINCQTKLLRLSFQNLLSRLEAAVPITKRQNFSMSMETTGQALTTTRLIGD